MTVSLLRQLKYVEDSMLSNGRNVYSDEAGGDGDGPGAADAEMVLLDLL